jgi:hypothetical protein
MKTPIPDLLQSTDLVKHLGVSRRTILRWRKTGMPPTLARLTLFLTLGELSAIATQWRGWRIQQGFLYSPYGYGLQFTAGEIIAIPLLHSRIAALEQRLRTSTRTETKPCSNHQTLRRQAK